MPSLPEIPILKKKEAAPEPKVSSPQTTPREIMTARLVNDTPGADTPPITVGKLIEFADRYLACDCSEKRFVQSWTRTANGYSLITNSVAIKPISLTCQEGESNKSCFLNEIDRGSQVADLKERFVPGGEFIEFMYKNGLKCERVTPCPPAQ
ncbi:MAG: hypothetical protein AAF387_06415 [Pseudomonadota bacterium]